MTLPVSPNAISMAAINSELAQTVGHVISLNDTLVRSLLAKTTTNSVISLSDAWGKSKVVKVATPIVTIVSSGGGVTFNWDAVAGGRYWIYLNGSGTAVEVLTNSKSITGLGNNVSQTIRVYITKTGDTTSNTCLLVTGYSWPQVAISGLTVVPGLGSLTYTWTVDANVTYTGFLDGGTGVSVSSPKTFNSLSAASHTFYLTGSQSNYVDGSTSLAETPALATAIVINAAAVNGTLVAITSKNFYSFTAPVAATYTVTMRSTPIDCYLELYDATNTTQLASNDDGGGGHDSLMTYLGVAGTTYYIYAHSFQYGSLGAYTISLTRTAVTLATPVFTAATGGIGTVSFTWGAVNLAETYDVTFNGSLTNQSGTTFSIASGVAGGTYSLSVVAKSSFDTSSSTGTSSNVTATVPKLATPAFTAAIGGSGTVSFTWGAVTGATSYDVIFNGTTTNQVGVTFTRSSGVAAGSYALTVVAKASGYINSDAMLSTTVTVTVYAPTAIVVNATPTSGTLAAISSIDYYSFTTVTAITYTVALNGAPSFDAYVELYDSTNTTQLAVNDDGGGNNNSLMTYQCVANTSYIIRVHSFNFGGSGAYTLALTATLPTLGTPIYSTASGGINAVSFVWSSISGATSYDVTFNGSTANQAGTAFSSTSVTAGTYNLTVVAKAVGYINSSNGVSFNVTVTAAVIETLSVVFTNVTSSGVTATVTCSPGRAVLYYYVYLYTVPYNSGTPAFSPPSSGAAQVFTGLSASTTYYADISVRFVTGGGFSDMSPSTNYFTTTAVSVLPSATLISPTHRQIMRVVGSTMPTWYSFTPINTGYYTFTLSSIIDPWIEVWNSTATSLIGEDDDSGIGNCSQKDLSLSSGIEYRIKARGYSSAATAAHELAIYGGRCTMYLNPTTIQGTISLSSEQITYLFVPASSQTCTVVMKGDIADTYLIMSDYTGVILNAPSTDDDAGDGAWAQFSYSFVANNYYYISCMAYSSATTGNFTLTIT